MSLRLMRTLLLKKHAYIDVEAEVIHMILSGIGDDIYSITDAFLQQLHPEWSRFMTVVKQTADLGKESYHKLFDILKQYQNEVNEIHAEKIARNAIPLALVAAAQHYPDNHYQVPKPHKPYAPSSRQTTSIISHASTKNKGKEIDKPITPPSESASEEEDCDLEQGFGHFAKECRKSKWVKDYAYHKEKMMLCKQEEKGVPLSTEQDEHVVLAKLIANLKLDTDENKKIQKQLRKENASLTYELNECKYALEESNDIRDRCRSALHQKEVELEKWQQPITHEINVLVKNLLLPLAIKTKENANEFEKLLKEEMFDDLQYVQSLEKEVDELESEKAEFSKEYDLLLQECVSKDIMCSILQYLVDIDEQTELQCLYLEKI
ncbi:hypothetical protein Tco_0438905 [Tanacetum coccineum]